MILKRPCENEINNYLKINDISFNVTIPTNNKEEWDKSHRDFVLKVLMPLINPPIKIRKILTEAYLTDVLIESTNETFTYEQILSNGSTLVPDISYDWGRIKDIWGVTHDYLYHLHKFKSSDIYGHHWGLIETHNIYRDGWISQKKALIGWIWWSGLMAGGWFSWNFPFNNKPEHLSKIEFKTYGTTNI